MRSGSNATLRKFIWNACVVSSQLVSQDQIAFNAGSHSELIKMSYEDFARLVKPKMITMH